MRKVEASLASTDDIHQVHLLVRLKLKSTTTTNANPTQLRTADQFAIDCVNLKGMLSFLTGKNGTEMIVDTPNHRIKTGMWRIDTVASTKDVGLGCLLTVMD